MTIIICLECNKKIGSEHGSIVESCGCPNEAFIDTNLNYTRIGANDLKKIKVLDNKNK